MKVFRLIINHESCWGCRACEVACKQENKVHDGVKLIKVLEDGPRMNDEKPEFMFRVNACHHCDEPPCIEVCPEEAISKRDDGIVIMDDSKCSGCRLCLEECPYDAIEFDPKNDVARKCNLCLHRVVNGLIPACADNVCIAHCIYFGDPDVISSKVRS